MSRTTRYPRRLLAEPVPARALIDGQWVDGEVTAWASKAGGWHAWFRLPDGQVRLVHERDVEKVSGPSAG